MSDASKNLVQQAVAAAARIADVILETPLTRSPELSAATSAEVYLKLENLQHTGSFKLRGASNCLLSISEAQRAKGVVAASSGNHGAALAYAMRELGIGGQIFVPEQSSTAKVEAIRGYGGEVHFFGRDGLETEQHARALAKREGRYYVSPYNDPSVVAGQATCGLEIIRQLPDVDAAFVAVGGGGLISGVGSVLKEHNPALQLFACQPSASPVMAKSVAAGRILDMPSDATLSDGTAGGVEQDALTFAYCRELADDWVLVDESAIAAAMRNYLAIEPHPIEGAAGVALAALDACKDLVKGRRIVVIICGGNITAATRDAIVAGRDSITH